MGTGRLLLWAAIAVAAIDTIFFSGASNFLASPQARILNQAIMLVVAVGVALAVRGRAVDLRSPLLPPILGWVAATVLGTLLSQRPPSSLEALALLLLAAPTYLAVRAVVWSPWLGPRIDRLLVGATTVFVGAYLLQAAMQWMTWWSIAGPSLPPLRPGDVGLTVGTANAVALYLELLVPFAVWRSWTIWRSRAFTISLAALSFLALLVTGSRGAWIGTAAAAVMLIVSLWWDAGRPVRIPGGARSRGLGLLGATALAIGAVLLGPPLLTRLLSGDAGRIELWSAAWAMFLSSPLVGVGPGAWPDLRPLTLISEPNLAVLITSHNSVLHVLAELGIIGLGAAVWLVAVIVRSATNAIRTANGGERTLRLVCAASLVAAGVHSLVDSQFHIPAVALLILHLMARLDPPAPAPRVRDPQPVRPALIASAGAVGVITAVIALVPINAAMVQAQLGNLALDRGDFGAALPHFEAATTTHELGPYRLGLGLARAGLGDLPAAQVELARAEEIAAFTFVTASLAVVADDPGQALRRIDVRGPYDPTATVNAAAIRFPVAPDAATRDLATAMVAVPPLTYSARPPALFDDASWEEAQRTAIEVVAGGDPATASALARLAGFDDLSQRYAALVGTGPHAHALELLDDAVLTGSADIDRARALLRESPGSPVLHGILVMLAFEARSQVLLDDIRAVSVPLFFGMPLPPMELVVDGAVDADYSLRLPRYPMAANARQGPSRPYPLGMITIEPVLRPRD